MRTMDEFISKFENTIEGVEAGSLHSETVFRSLKQWDSLALLMFIDMIDAEYDVRLNSGQMKAAQTLGELYGLISGDGGMK